MKAPASGSPSHQLAANCFQTEAASDLRRRYWPRPFHLPPPLPLSSTNGIAMQPALRP